MSRRLQLERLHSCLNGPSRLLPTRRRSYAPRYNRAFSSTPHRQYSLSDVLTAVPTGVLDGLHATGLPWWIVIPATAVVARGSVAFFTRSKRNTQTAMQSVLEPLMQARALANLVHGTTASTKFNKTVGPQMSVAPGLSPQEKMRRAVDLFFTRRNIAKRFGIGMSWTGLFNFAVLISFSEAIRRKCSDREGLLSFLLRPFEWLKSLVFPPAEPNASTTGIGVAQAEATTTTVGNTGMASQEVTLFDPTLSVEGIPGWCENLTATDPTLILPIALGLLMATPTLVRRYRGKKQTILDRGFLTLALIYVPVGMSIPSAILLYLVSSFGTGLIEKQLLDRQPKFTPITACKQRLRPQQVKEWSDVQA